MNMQEFLPEEIIRKKRDGQTLTAAEINYFISGHHQGIIPDYQMSAFLMSVYFQGMGSQETVQLTNVMKNSGQSLTFDDPLVIDKHSTGGVGDKTSMVVAPLAASVGVKVAMMAGKGLGHTGGTIDKLQSIPHFDSNIKFENIKTHLHKHGLFIIGQSNTLAPSDKKIYALRDVTATVESIPLIASSIMSKKLACGASGLVMDFKIGSGSFLKTMKNAKALKKQMVLIGKNQGMNFMSIISNMNHPLGRAVGNSLEIAECIETLKGNGPKDLEELCLHLAGGMIYLAKIASSHKKGISMAKAALANGQALKKFEEFIKAQKGDPSVITHPDKLKLAKLKATILATKKGNISSIDALSVGHALVHLGGGRKEMNDSIDLGVGFLFHKSVGDKIKENEPIVSIYYNEGQENIVKDLQENFNSFIKISSKPVKKPTLIFDTETTWCAND